MNRVLAGLALGMLSLDGPALAADIPLKAPRLQPVYDWTGLYFGAHAGFGRGHSNAVLSDPAIATTSHSFGGPIGGLQAGYNVQLPSRIVLGFEADVSFPNYIDGNSVISTLATAKSYAFDRKR
jgi:high affinity Mn2+ porin